MAAVRRTILAAACFAMMGALPAGADDGAPMGGSDAQTAATETSAPTLAPGTRVRVTLESEARRLLLGGGTVEGEVLSLDHEKLLLTVPERSEPLELSRSAIKRLDVSRGMGRAAREGATIGGTVGFAGGACVGWTFTEMADGYQPPSTLLLGALIGGGAGAVVLGSVGALIGATTQIEKWERVAPEHFALAVAPTGRHGVSAQLSLRF
jgi:hypothetical protein